MDSNNHVAYSKEHIRFAVLSFFLAQGLCFQVGQVVFLILRRSLR